MKAISLPFSTDGYGKIITTTDPQKVWADRAKTAVTTPLGSRIMRPSYGCATPLQMFANTEDAGISFDSDVTATFSQWLPDLKYNGVDIVQDPVSSEIAVSVNYSTPVALESDQVTIVVEF